MQKKFIIFAPDYDENVGGVIALHRLCHLLNIEGENAFLWPFCKPRWRYPELIKTTFRFLYRLITKRANIYNQENYKVFADFITPIAKYSYLKNAIVIYPEIVNGNPLFSKNIVRWFLYKPGQHTGIVDYGDNELYFYYQKSFNDEKLNPNSENLLQTLFIRDEIYHQTNFGPRSGTCYILRKGRGRKLVHDKEKSVLIDGLSHTETAKLFNSVEMCISYDLYTLYSQYAALCGCISVVVPEEGLTKEDWIPDEKKRYGVAYGFNDIDHAIETRKYILPMLKEEEKMANLTVRNFIKKCERYFLEK